MKTIGGETVTVYIKKYPFCAEEGCGLTILEAERAFQLLPDPPKVDNINDYIVMAACGDENGFPFFMHAYEERLNRRIRGFLLREGFRYAEPDRLFDYKLACVRAMLEVLPNYDPNGGASFLTYAHHDIENAMIGQRMNEEGGSFASLDEYKSVRKAGRLYRENQENTRETVKAFAEAEHCSEQTAEAHLATAIKNRSREDFYPYAERDADGNLHQRDPDVSHDDCWDYASVLWGWVQTEWVQEAFEKLSFREQTLLEKHNAICMTCGRVSDWRRRVGFEDLAVLFEGSGASGAERAYQRALEKMMKHLAGHEVFHVLQMRLETQEKKNKKIAAAVYSYGADYDGEWGEIRFDFLRNETEIVKLADGDYIKSQPFAKRAIREIQALGSDTLPKKLTVPFWYEWEAPMQIEKACAFSCNAPRKSSDRGMIIRWV
ncbi:MAG: hypothetical protein U0N00_02255 [Oscillospiraceae bacterium]